MLFFFFFFFSSLRFSLPADPETDYARLLAKHVFLLLGRNMSESRQTLLQHRSHQRQPKTQYSQESSMRQSPVQRRQQQRVDKSDVDTEQQLRNLVDCSFSSSQQDVSATPEDAIQSWENELNNKVMDAFNIDSKTYSYFRENINPNLLQSPKGKSPESARRETKLARSASPIQQDKIRNYGRREWDDEGSLNSTLQNETGLSRTDSRENLFGDQQQTYHEHQTTWSKQVSTHAKSTSQRTSATKEEIQKMEEMFRQKFDEAQEETTWEIKRLILNQIESLAREKKLERAACMAAWTAWRAQVNGVEDNAMGEDSSEGDELRRQYEIAQAKLSEQDGQVEYLHNYLQELETKLQLESARATEAEERLKQRQTDVQRDATISAGALGPSSLNHEKRSVAESVPAKDPLAKPDVSSCSPQSMISWFLFFAWVLTLFTLFALVAALSGQFDTDGKLESLQSLFTNSLVHDTLASIGSYMTELPCASHGQIYADCFSMEDSHNVFTCG